MSREIDHQMEAAYTVRQLRELLEGEDDDARIFFVCSYGDYHSTQQALPVGEVMDADTTNLGETAYSQSGVCLLEERDPSDEPAPEVDEDEVFPVLILRS